ncbi:MAG TPA: AAA family ATPase, partial [Chloroflexia bacterium]|nr:AAA family ATPase [Chloroflexia bacterium]
MNNGKRINPLSRRPRRQRLVVAVRGAAGSGKSVFAATLADAGLGRLCYFDVERKARLMAGSDGSKFDAIEIQHPDELPEFIEWALVGEGRQQGYTCYVLDSWAMYFGRKHRETVQAVRERTGDPTAQPSADELAADQMIFQEVLRRLCIDSGACVVVTDQIAAKGREDREENELGRVLPMTSGGLEYFVDVMVEASVRVVDFETERVFRVIKTNSPAFPVGMELINPTFADFLAQLGEGVVAVDAVAVPEVAAVLDEITPLALVRPAGPTLDDLRTLAQ